MIPTLQHVNGDSNDPSDLKAFCRRCNLADAQASFVPVESGSPKEKMAKDLERRWSSRWPLRLCDDDRRWGSMWTELTRSARELMLEQEGSWEASGDEGLPGFQGWTQQGTPIQEF